MLNRWGTYLHHGEHVEWMTSTTLRTIPSPNVKWTVRQNWLIKNVSVETSFILMMTAVWIFTLAEINAQLKFDELMYFPKSVQIAIDIQYIESFIVSLYPE